MADDKELQKLGKKVAEAVQAYGKAQADLVKLQRNIGIQGDIMKSGVPGQMGPAAVELTKLTPKLGAAIKKADDARRKMEAANKAYSKAS